MKIVNSLRSIYEEKLPLYEALKEEVDNYLLTNKQSRWHYESRLKKLDSFSLKAETSRFEKLSELEDFFAASLVVENHNKIDAAVELLKKKFEVVSTRPKEVDTTHKDPSSFVFDDLRVYLRIPIPEMTKPKGFEEVIFEIQIKTFLQHAWSIATHDLIYKGAESNWGDSRIAYQVKAMLEHAELSISESSQLSDNKLVKKTNKTFENREKCLSFLKETWEEALLPDDLLRLSDNILSLSKKIGYSIDDLIKISKDSELIGENPIKNLPPYSAIASALISSDTKRFTDRLSKQKYSKKIFLPIEAKDHLENEWPSIEQYLILAE